MVGGLPGNSFVFVEFQEGRGIFQVAALALHAVGLDIAEHVQVFLKLAGEPLGVHAKGGEGAGGVDDVEVDCGLLGGGVGGAIKKGGFQVRDAVETPGGVGEFLGELGFRRGSGFVFVEELGAGALGGVGVFSGEDVGAAGESVGEGVPGRALLAGVGTGSGGEKRVGAVGVGARGGDRICHLETSNVVL